MVRSRLAEPDAAKGFILDGFPRTLPQADTLDIMLEELGVELDAVVEFAVSDDVVVERLLGRGRSDDTEEVIRNRQKVYRDETAPLLDHYRDQARERRRRRVGGRDHPAARGLAAAPVNRGVDDQGHAAGCARCSPAGAAATSSSRPPVRSTPCASPARSSPRPWPPSRRRPGPG